MMKIRRDLLVRSLESLVCCAFFLACSYTFGADISQASQLSATYDQALGVVSVYYGDSSGHLNEIQVNGLGQELNHVDLTENYNLPTITSPTVSAVYDATTGDNLIFYLSGTSTANVVMITETPSNEEATASFPFANAFKVGGAPQPANKWQSVWASVDTSGDIDVAVQAINGQDDPADPYGPRGDVSVGGVVGTFAGKTVNIYEQIGRDPEHVQQQVHLFYDPNWPAFVVAWDPEGEGHIHVVEYNPATDYYNSEDLMDTTSSIHMDDTASGSGGSTAVCTPSGFSFATEGNDAELYYYGGDDNIHEIASTSPGNWGSLDITSATGAPQIQEGCGPISSIYNSTLGKTEVAYTSPNQASPSGYQLNVLTGNILNGWSDGFTLTGNGAPILGSPMASSNGPFGAGIFYIGDDPSLTKHLYLLSYNSTSGFESNEVGN